MINKKNLCFLIWIVLILLSFILSVSEFCSHLSSLWIQRPCPSYFLKLTLKLSIPTVFNPAYILESLKSFQKCRWLGSSMDQLIWLSRDGGIISGSVVVVLILWNKVSCSPGHPQIHHVFKDDLELLIFLPSLLSDYRYRPQHTHNSILFF